MNKQNKTFDIIEFLKESNGIEGVYDARSLMQAIYAWEYLISQDKLTPGVILKTHKILMLHQPLQPDEKGYFRTIPIYIGGKMGIDANEIKHDIDHWISDMNGMVKYELSERRKQSIKLHVYYEKIHPFVDGNGRTGRMFMNWFRVKNGLPILVIKEDERQNYYYWFK